MLGDSNETISTSCTFGFISDRLGAVSVEFLIFAGAGMLSALDKGFWIDSGCVVTVFTVGVDILILLVVNGCRCPRGGI